MKDFPKILRSALAVLTVLVLLVVPYAHTARLPVDIGERATCHCCCSCCQETSNGEKTVDIKSKCGCDIAESEPLTEMPPATITLESKNDLTVISFKSGGESFNIDKPVTYRSAAVVVFDDTGPPLFLVNSSFVI